MSDRDPQYEWQNFIEHQALKGDARMEALVPLAKLLAADPDLSLLYPYTSLWFFGLSKKPWVAEPHGFDVALPHALGEPNGEISLLVGQLGFKEKTYTVAKGSPEYIFNVLKALHKKS